MTTISLEVGGTISGTTITASNGFVGSGALLTDIPFSALTGSGTPNTVYTNNGAGAITTLTQLTPLLGGTGQDFSIIGAGPFLPTISSGVFSATLEYATTASANKLVQMDGTNAISVGIVNCPSVSTIAINTTADLTFASSGSGSLVVGTMPIKQIPATISGSVFNIVSGNITTTGVTETTIITIATITNTTYAIDVVLSYGNPANNKSASHKFFCKAINVAGTVTASGITNSITIRDAGISNLIKGGILASGTNITITVTGATTTTYNWCATAMFVAQTLA
jgi:hypothetical protein